MEVPQKKGRKKQPGSYRSAKTGKYVSESYAKRNPDTTVFERKRSKKK